MGSCLNSFHPNDSPMEEKSMANNDLHETRTMYLAILVNNLRTICHSERTLKFQLFSFFSI